MDTQSIIHPRDVVAGDHQITPYDPNSMTLACAADGSWLSKAKKRINLLPGWVGLDGKPFASAILWETFRDPTFPTYWYFRRASIPDFAAMVEGLNAIRGIQTLCLLRGGVHPDVDLTQQHQRKLHHSVHPQGDIGGALIDVPVLWIGLDLDKGKLAEGLSWFDDPDACIAWIVGQHLPEPFRGRSCVWQLSNSCGVNADPRAIKVHLYMRATEPTLSRDLYAVVSRQPFKAILDPAFCQVHQINFTANPELRAEKPRQLANGKTTIYERDPLPRRVGFYQGTADTVDLAPYVETAKVARAETETTFDIESVQRPGDFRDYSRAWERIVTSKMGYKIGGDYHNSVYALICSAIWHNETDWERLATNLRKIVRWRLETLGESNPNVERYLSDREIGEAVKRALRSAGGAS